MFLRECGAPPPRARPPGSLDIALVATAGAMSRERYKVDNECEFMACMGGGASVRFSSFPLPFSNAEPTVLLTHKIAVSAMKATKGFFVIILRVYSQK